MGADYPFYVKFIATRAPTFFGYIISVLAHVGTTPNQTEHIWTYELGTQFLLDLETIKGPEKDHYEVTKVRGTNITGIRGENYVAIYLNLDEQDKMSILLVSKKNNDTVFLVFFIIIRTI